MPNPTVERQLSTTDYIFLNFSHIVSFYFLKYNSFNSLERTKKARLTLVSQDIGLILEETNSSLDFFFDFALISFLDSKYLPPLMNRLWRSVTSATKLSKNTLGMKGEQGPAADVPCLVPCQCISCWVSRSLWSQYFDNILF